jgi:predicted nucleic acid-binding protein
VACAEAGGADLLVTTDDRMIRRANRAEIHGSLRVVTPAEAISLVIRRRQ